MGPRSGILCPPKYEIWFEMGFNGSIGVHIKTGRRHMAEDHFRTFLDPPKGYERSHEDPGPIGPDPRSQDQVPGLGSLVQVLGPRSQVL